MDFSGIWQEHKTFITLVVAGLLALLIGEVVISEVYPVDAERKALRRSVSDIRRLEAVERDFLAGAEESNDRYSTRLEAVLARVNFVPREKFLLKPTGSADIQYFRILSEERELLVELPKTLNISVDNNLGMPELSPTREKDIQRALLVLDVVDRVVGLAIESNLREVSKIEMIPDLGRRKTGFVEEMKVGFKVTATLGALAVFFEKIQFLENYLAIDSAEIESNESGGQQIEADFVVSALTIVQEERD
jgi:hypothetical protein